MFEVIVGAKQTLDLIHWDALWCDIYALWDAQGLGLVVIENSILTLPQAAPKKLACRHRHS